MFDLLQHHFSAASTRQRTWLAWAAAGAAVQACVPGLHGAWTAVGPVALWLWLLPLAALALELAMAPAALADDGHGARRRLRHRPPARVALSRRDRARPMLRAAAQPARRAG
jgi:hypothetical protein